VNPVTRLPDQIFAVLSAHIDQRDRRVTHYDGLSAFTKASISAMDVALSGMSHIGYRGEDCVEIVCGHVG